LKLYSTYRIQLNKNFTFENVIEILDYLKELGISHLYLSPVFQARPNSTHGYDVVDYSKINEELGGEEEYKRLLREAKSRGLGIIQDIVPNHMAVHEKNWRLMDVLKKGKNSKYYKFFDFYPEEEKIRLPILEDELIKVIEKGLIKIEKIGEEYYVVYRDWKLPLNGVKESLEETLNSQHYILTFWNNPPSYRRFFDVNELIGVNEEIEEVFEEVHSKILEFDLDGFRVDHVDGLYDPINYVKKLKEKSKGKIILVEKILGFKEKLFEGPDGTTGYDFLNYSNLLFHFNEEKVTRVYYNFIGEEKNVDEEIRESKEKIIDELFKFEITRFAKLLNLTFDELKKYLICLNKYRTYGEVIEECDKTGKLKEIKSTNAYYKLQQIMPAIYAKSYEDTFLFRYNRLISLNEVGSDLHYFTIECEKFHEFNEKRVGTLSLNATSTHDTKYSEDFRMKISVISEIPEEWERRVKEWHEILNPNIDKNDEYRFYQVLLGSYFLDGFSESYKDRIKQHMIKSLREAKVHTSWLNVNKEYEDKMLKLIEEAFSNKQFKESFREFELRIRRLGMLKSLSLLILKILSPGIPDFYQGTESWRYLLTDPDNRSQVDFKRLIELFERSKKFDNKMLEDMNDGRIKIHYTYKLLNLRRKYEINELSYKGEKLQKGLCGFWRGDKILVIVKTLSTLPKITVNIQGKFVDYITGEEFENEIEIDQLPRVLIKE